MARVNQVPFNTQQFNEIADRNAAQNAAAAAARKKKRSVLLQRLLNYFDDADVRVRRSQNSLDAQFLNAFALSLEDTEMRLAREEAVQDMARCPINVDNFGTYFKIQVPDTYEYDVTADGSLIPPKVRVFTAENRWKVISAYDDLLPVPSLVEVAGDPVPCRSLTIYELQGNGLRQEGAPGRLVFENHLFLKVDNLGEDNTVLEVTLEGKVVPTAISLTGQPTTTEVIQLREEMVVKTRYAWAQLDRLSVLGLPAGATLRIAITPAAFQLEPDPQRPASHPDFRDLLFERCWSLSGAYLKESMFLNRWSGHETIQMYRCTPTWNAFALEPNTYGILGLSGTTLYYADRRESMPDNLKRTATYREPLYNLLAEHDAANTDKVRRVILRPLRNARSRECLRHRFTVELPDGSVYAVAPNGMLIHLSPTTGWRAESPVEISIPLTDNGSYRFTLETAGSDGQIYEEVVAYANQAVDLLWQQDLSEIIPNCRAVLFDRYQRLWVWTGDQMIPLRMVYDNYVFDPDTRSLYLTNSYDQVELS